MRWKPHDLLPQAWMPREPGMLFSLGAHGALLAVGLIAFSGSAPFPDQEEAIAVEVVDPSALNQVTRGERNAEKVQELPRDRAERASEIVEKKEAGEEKRDVAAPPTRPPELKTAEENRAPPEAAPPPPKQAEAEKKPEPRPEQRREELQRLAEQAEIEARQAKAEEERKAAAKAKAEAEAAARAKAEADAKAKAVALAKAKADAEAKAKREAEQAAKFNANDITRLLQSKERAQSSGSAAPQPNRTASLGTPTGSAQRLSPSMRAQIMGIIKEQLERCWSVPVALQNSPRPVVPSLRMQLAADGAIIGRPSVINNSSDPLFRVAADSAMSASLRCSPLKIPAQFQAFYQDWRDIVVNFDARDVL